MDQTERPESAAVSCDSARYAEVRGYVERLLAAPAFSAAPRRARLLRYLVDRTLSGEGDRINEYSIGIDVFEKLPSFDPRSDSMVRTDVMRLRQRLRQYYSEEGRADAIVLDLPARSYRVAIEFRDSRDSTAHLETSVVEAPPAETSAPRRPRREWVWALIAAVVVTAVAGAGLAWQRFRRHPPLIQSVIVLPFQDFSSDHQSGYLADGLTDEITNELANLDGLRVIARTTAFEFKGKGIDIRDIGRRINVDGSIEGSIDREGDRIRIRVQLNRNADGYHLWSHVYDVTFRDLIAVQRDIARSISDDLQLSRSFSESASGSPPRHDPGAEVHELYLRGVDAFFVMNLESARRAATLFQSVVDRDPEFAQAWLTLANTHWNIGIFSGWNGVSVAQVESEARRALDVDPRLASAHATLGSILWRHDFDWTRAESEFRLALQYGASQYNVHNLYAACLAERGRFAESHRQFRLAQEISPLAEALYTNEAGLFIAEGRLGDAERIYRQVLGRKPGFSLALNGMAQVRLKENDCSGAASYAAELSKVSPGSRYSKNVDWSVMVCRGDVSTARQILNREANAMPNFDVAAGYTALGDKDRAFAYLRKSAELREVGVTSVKNSPYFESLRSDTRLTALEREVGLEP